MANADKACLWESHFNSLGTGPIGGFAEENIDL